MTSKLLEDASFVLSPCGEWSVRCDFHTSRLAARGFGSAKIFINDKGDEWDDSGSLARGKW